MKLLILIPLLFTQACFADVFSSQVWLEHFISRPDGGSNQGTSFVETYFNFKLPQTHKLELKFEVAYSHENKEADLRDPRVTHRVNLYKNKMINLNSDTRVFLGLSENSKDSTAIISRVTWAPDLTIHASRNKQASLSFTYKPYVTKYFNNEDINLSKTKVNPQTGSSELVPNIDVDIYNLFWASLTLNKAFNFSSGIAYLMQWNTLGDRVDDSFEFIQEFNYIANPNLTLVVGHSNSGALYEKDGQRNSIDFANGDSETIYFKTIISF